MSKTGRRGLRTRLAGLYERHRRPFWALHSLWALATGILVVVLARHGHRYAEWVLLVLGLTWASTLFFSRVSSGASEGGVKWAQEVVSYLTRVMYQETLFFLLPFYFYSTTLDSPNALFLVLLGVLAVLACLDEVFDRLLRRHRWFGLFFFALVAFAALNFLLPLVFGLRLELATTVAVVAGLLAALPLVERPRGAGRARKLAALLLPALAAAGLLLWLRILVPPVPLNLAEFTFARDVRAETIEAIDPLTESARLSRVDDRLAIVARIFAPRRVPVRVEIHWAREGRELKVSRELEITPHENGFRVWDVYSPAEVGLTAGTYTVAIRTIGGQLVGRGKLRLVE